MNDSNKVKVLLIEDDKRVRELYELVLSIDDYEVVSAETGEEGLEHAKKSPFDIIFLDIRLPNMSGLEVLEQLRKYNDTKDTPVIILSNLDDETVISQGLSLGANEYVIKSHIIPKELLEYVEDWKPSGKKRNHK